MTIIIWKIPCHIIIEKISAIFSGRIIVMRLLPYIFIGLEKTCSDSPVLELDDSRYATWGGRKHLACKEAQTEPTMLPTNTVASLAYPASFIRRGTPDSTVATNVLTIDDGRLDGHTHTQRPKFRYTWAHLL